MIDRELASRVRVAAGQFPVVTVTGPRQSGKSTLCRALFDDRPFVSLEDPDVRSFAHEDPRGFLSDYPEGAVFDEVQRTPELPSYLQGLVDADPRPGRFVLTGSQNLALLESVSQSLAGRTAVLHLLPMSRRELLRFDNHPTTLESTLLAGGYPRIFDRQMDPAAFLSAYVATYVERDVRTITNVGDLVTFQRFIELCAGRTGQLLNLSNLASDCGISQPTAKSWLSVLETSFLVFRLPAFAANVSKRLVKAPKLHFHDTGLACWLLGIREPAQLNAHPLRGPIFESWVVSEILKHRNNRGETRGLTHYRDAQSKEADLILETGDGAHLVEAKASRTAAGNLFDGIAAMRDIVAGIRGSCAATVVYGGSAAQRRGELELVPWTELHTRSW